MSTISIIIPVYNGGAALCKCLDAIAASNVAPLETIVVVDGPGANDAVAARQRGARVIDLPTRGGPAAARNAGAAQARGDILLFLDADVLPHADVVGAVKRAMEDEAGFAAIFGSYDDSPADPHFVSQYKNLFHHYTHQRGVGEASTFWAGCGSIRRDAFEQVGGFNAERYPRPSIEDIELGYRLRDAGGTIQLIPSIQVKHLKRWTFLSLVRTEFFDRALPWTRLLLQRRRPSDLNLNFINRASVMLVGLMLICGIGAVAFWTAGLGVAGLAIVLLVLNLPIYRFFLARRGLFFTVGAIGLHWLYYFYSGLAFAIGTLAYRIGGITRGKIGRAPHSSRNPDPAASA